MRKSILYVIISSQDNVETDTTIFLSEVLEVSVKIYFRKMTHLMPALLVDDAEVGGVLFANNISKICGQFSLAYVSAEYFVAI